MKLIAILIVAAPLAHALHFYLHERAHKRRMREIERRKPW